MFSISKKALNQDIFKQLNKHLTNNQPKVPYKQKKNLTKIFLNNSVNI